MFQLWTGWSFCQSMSRSTSVSYSYTAPQQPQILNVGSLSGQKSQATMDANPVRVDRKCYNCGERGIYAHQCPNPFRQSLIQQANEKEKVHPED
jgi:hypothetical protein